MNSTVTAKTTLTSLISSFAGQNDRTELRGKKPEGAKQTVLYSKSRMSNVFGGGTVREGKQKMAREAVKTALVAEFSSRKESFGDQATGFLHMVARDMKGHFDSGPMTLEKVKKINTATDEAQKMAKVNIDCHEAHKDDAPYKAGLAASKRVMADAEGGETSLEKAIEDYHTLAIVSSKSEENLFLLGALKAHVEELSLQKQDALESSRAAGMKEMAFAKGAEYVQELPQGLVLRRIGSPDQAEGLCSSLVGLVAIEEQRGASGVERGNGALDRMQAETTKLVKEGMRRPTAFADSVSRMRTNVAFAEARSNPVRSGKFIAQKNLMNQMKDTPDYRAGRPVFWGLQFMSAKGSHTIMIGADPRSPGTFTFYDPNLGLARFSNAESLTAFFQDFLAEYGEDYNIPKATEKDLERAQGGVCSVGDFKFGDIAQFKIREMAGQLPEMLGGPPPPPASTVFRPAPPPATPPPVSTVIAP